MKSLKRANKGIGVIEILMGITAASIITIAVTQLTASVTRSQVQVLNANRVHEIQTVVHKISGQKRGHAEMGRKSKLVPQAHEIAIRPLGKGPPMGLDDFPAKIFWSAVPSLVLRRLR